MPGAGEAIETMAIARTRVVALRPRPYAPLIIRGPCVATWSCRGGATALRPLSAMRTAVAVASPGPPSADRNPGPSDVNPV